MEIRRMRVAVLGTGTMGAPIATHVHAGGHTVAAWNRTPERAEPLAQRGISVAPNCAHAVSDADVVILSLSDDAAVRAVLTEPDGVFDNARPGCVIVDTSTIGAATAVELSQAATGRGHAHLDAPVSGGAIGACAGRLSVMVGGSFEALAEVRPVLETFSAAIAYVGASGSGQIVKAANQVVVAATLAGIADAYALLNAAGIDLGLALAVLNGGLAESRVLNVKAEPLIAGDFTPTFRLQLHRKDLQLAAATARALGSWSPTTYHLLDLFDHAIDAGLGPFDHSAVARLVDERRAADQTNGDPHHASQVNDITT
jgi:2-hydroxy-3-oxopropionate reductase